MAALFDPLKQVFTGDVVGNLRRGADNGQRVPVTRTKTSYALTIHATVGKKRGVIGAVYEITPRQTLNVEEVWEINSFGRGKPRELVPQNLSGRTLNIKRYDLYTATCEEVFGDPELITLADQIGPVNLRLMWKSVDQSTLGPIIGGSVMKIYEFVDCYMTDIGRTISAENDVVVRADATLVWRDIKRLQ